MMKYCGALAALIVMSSQVSAQDVSVQDFDWDVVHHKVSVIDNTIKQANTPEGQAIIGAVATTLGVDPKTTSIALAALAQLQKPDDSKEDMGTTIQSPPGYSPTRRTAARVLP